MTETLPYVGSVKVKRHLPTGLELVVTKTDATFAVTQDGYFTLLNEKGKVLEANTEFIGENITLLNLGNIISANVGQDIELESKDLLDKLIEVQTACNESGIKDISSIDLSDIYNIKLTYQGRITLELGETNKSNLVKKLALGAKAIEHQNEENELFRGTINLTVDGKGFLSEETSTTETTTLPESTTVESTTNPAA